MISLKIVIDQSPPLYELTDEDFLVRGLVIIGNAFDVSDVLVVTGEDAGVVSESLNCDRVPFPDVPSTNMIELLVLQQRQSSEESALTVDVEQVGHWGIDALRKNVEDLADNRVMALGEERRREWAQLVHAYHVSLGVSDTSEVWVTGALEGLLLDVFGTVLV